MVVRYIRFIDSHDKELAKWDSEDPDMDQADPDYWDGCCPNQREQVYFPNHGLYEIERIRYIFSTPGTSELEVKLSFIRKGL